MRIQNVSSTPQYFLKGLKPTLVKPKGKIDVDDKFGERLVKGSSWKKVKGGKENG